MEEPSPQIYEYIHQLKLNGRAEETQTSRLHKLKQLSKLCNINNPYEVKELLTTKKWRNSTKETIIDIFKSYYKFIGKTWEAPKYYPEETPPFIPTEQEIDILIASARKKLATLLQVLKETGIRTGEATKLQWTNIDTARRTITITASKHGNGRILPISDRLIGMLAAIQPTDPKIFPQAKKTVRTAYYSLRKRTTAKLNNPRLLKITLHTFRHWKATMEYHKTKDIIHVKNILGHKSIKSTMVYVNIEQAIFLQGSDEWTCKAASTIEESKQLIESGFEYVTEQDGIKLYRKRK